MAEPARNAFYERLDHFSRGQGNVAETIGSLGTALDKVASEISIIGESLAQGQTTIGACLGDIRSEIAHQADRPAEQALVALLGRIAHSLPAGGAGAAYLCLGVDVDGTFSQRSRLGQMLEKTAGEGLKEVLRHEREEYAYRARTIAQEEGFTDVTAADFRRFHALAEDLLGRIQAAPARNRRTSTGGGRSASRAEKNGDGETKR